VFEHAYDGLDPLDPFFSFCDAMHNPCPKFWDVTMISDFTTQMRVLALGTRVCVVLLVEAEHLRGDTDVDAVGYAEDRREELNLCQVEREAAGDGGPFAKLAKLI
jgi:hypothetical protein